MVDLRHWERDSLNNLPQKRYKTTIVANIPLPELAAPATLHTSMLHYLTSFSLRAAHKQSIEPAHVRTGYGVNCLNEKCCPSPLLKENN